MINSNSYNLVTNSIGGSGNVYSNMNDNSNQDSNDNTFKSYSPGNQLFSSYDCGIDIIHTKPHNQNTSEMFSNNDCSKMELRRQKNRESAARSRQKIKDKLNCLEKSLNKLEEQKSELMNEKELLKKEIDTLESNLITFGINHSQKYSDYESICFKEQFRVNN